MIQALERFPGLLSREWIMVGEEKKQEDQREG